MNLLLTSSGIKNKSIHDALVDLLGKPINESNALFIPTALYPFSVGALMAWDAICGERSSMLSQLGWKSVGILELTALPSIDKSAWIPTVQNADALLFWGGDPVYLNYWMHESGLTDLLPTLRDEAVYVGVSAGSIAASSIYGETFHKSHSVSSNALSSEEIVFSTPKGELKMNFVTARGAGLVDFALIPHLDAEHHDDATLANAEKWAAKLPVPVYAIDEETAIKVTGGIVEIISEGHWKLFTH